jgi:hypothetical protein
MIRTIAVGLLALVVVLPAQARTAAEFAAAWKQFRTTPTSEIVANPELGVLVNEFVAAGKAYRAEIEAAKAAGRTPRACLPEPVEFSTDDFIAAVDRAPADERQVEMPIMFGRILDARYPCAQPAA